jgi:ribosome-binding factor A
MNDRVLRLEHIIHREAARIIQNEVKDPRIGFVTITRVRMTPDLKLVTIYFSVLEGHGTIAQTLQGLVSARGYIRKRLGEGIRLKTTPQVRFEADSSVEENIRISRLLDQLKRTFPEGKATEP